MSLMLATLIPGLVLLTLGVLFLIANSAIVSAFKAMPRSSAATVIFFGVATVWFLIKVWNLPAVDFGEYRTYLFIGFGLVAVLSFFYVPDFLAVRGLAALMLLAASPLLDAAYMEHQFSQRRFMTAAVYVAIALAIYLGAAPFRLRDFFNWLFATRGRSRAVGGALAAYGLVLAVVAFTY